MTRLCVAIFVVDEAQARRDLALAAERGADLVELRVDKLEDVSVLDRLLAGKLLPVIVTCRPTWEGGQSALSDADRVAILDMAADAGAEFIDVEWETIRRHESLIREPLSTRGARADGRLIVSSHRFLIGRPPRLLNLAVDLHEHPLVDIPKLVWRAATIRDNLEAFELLRTAAKPSIVLCMDEAGLISRVLAKKFGAFLSFASLDAAGGTASGQVPVAEMKSLYRWDAIGPATKVYGVVGSPVGHSMSPAIHNAAFDATGHDGVYLPLLVNAGYESFKAFMESFLAFEGLHLSGLSVTIPHKQNAVRYLAERGADVEPLAGRIGAVNTIAIDGGVLRGTNTDYAAILDTITAALGVGRDGLAGVRVAVLGAGGTARAAVAGLAACGATVVVYNRTRDRADALAAEFDGSPGKVVSADWAKLCGSCCDVYVNTTSVGMSPDVDASPFGDAPPPLSGESLVFDAVYNPPVTKLLRQAEAAGAKTASGVEMFVRQAAAQFTTWTGRDAPVDVMRAVVHRRLAGG